MFKFSALKAQASSFLDQYKEKDPATFAAAQEAVGGLLILDGFIGIDNPFGGKKRPGIFGSFIGIIFGLVFIFLGPFIGNLTGINKMTATTTATVVSVGAPSPVTRDSNGNTNGGDCGLTAKYTVQGHDYSAPSSVTSTSNCQKAVGSSLAINYDPNDPGKWATDVATMKTIFKLFPLVGVIVALISLFTFTIRLLSIIFGWKLLKSGRALAKTLPGGASLGSQIKQIRQEFSHNIFGSSATSPAAAVMNAITQKDDNQTPPTQAPSAS